MNLIIYISSHNISARTQLTEQKYSGKLFCQFVFECNKLLSLNPKMGVQMQKEKKVG